MVKNNTFTYIIGEGIKNVFKNKKYSMLSFVTMVCAMLLFGIFFAIGENVNWVLEQVQRNQGIEVFIKTDATDSQINELENKIKELEGINTVTFKSKQEALEIMKQNLKDNADLLKSFEGENNIFPSSFVVTLTDLSLTQDIENKIKQMDSVKDITSKDETITTLMNIANKIKIVTGIISILLLVISIVIISNTIKLTVYSRRKEISIMKYVGATNSFIKWPFIIEGIVIGLMAGIVTLLIIAYIYEIIIHKVDQSTVLQQMNITLLQFAEMVKMISASFGILGVGIGVIGSSLSMKKYLNV